MSASTLDRRQVLRSLLELDRPVAAIQGDLAALAWDSEEEPVTLAPTHVIEILRRFKAGAVGAKDVESWANAIEGREDIEFAEDVHSTLREAIFHLANPDLGEALSAEIADRWIDRLDLSTRA